MDKYFFYGTIAVFLTFFLALFRKKKFGIRHAVLMIAYSLYNLIFEIVFGEILGLYYYIDKACSLVYIVISSVFLYPLIAVLYVFFLPGRGKVFLFTSGCIIAMLVLETVSLYTRTIVLTGWKVLPWSVIAYIASFALVYVINGLLLRILPDS